MTITVKRIGGSLAIVIPKALATEMGLTSGSTLDVTSTSSDSIHMRKHGKRPRRALESIVNEIKPAHYRRRNREMLENRAKGKEVW
jgi:antitoxin component of MazEF toxin-antitoxin module